MTIESIQQWLRGTFRPSALSFVVAAILGATVAVLYWAIIIKVDPLKPVESQQTAQPSVTPSLNPNPAETDGTQAHVTIRNASTPGPCPEEEPDCPKPSPSATAAPSPLPSAQIQQDSAKATEPRFFSRYLPITENPDTVISFISDMRGAGTSGRLIRFKARIGHSDESGMTRLVIDLQKGSEYDVALYAVEHRNEILDRVRADIRAAHPDLLEITADSHIILQHHSDPQYVRSILGRLSGRGVDFFIEGP